MPYFRYSNTNLSWSSFIAHTDLRLKSNQTTQVTIKAKKGKFPLEQAMKAQRGSKGIALLSSTSALGGWVVTVTPRLLYPGEET